MLNTANMVSEIPPEMGLDQEVLLLKQSNIFLESLQPSANGNGRLLVFRIGTHGCCVVRPLTCCISLTCLVLTTASVQKEINIAVLADVPHRYPLQSARVVRVDDR